jgi:hypothetical protein
MLDTSERAQTRARGDRAPPCRHRRESTPNRSAEHHVIEQLTRAFEANDVDAIVALLADAVRLAFRGPRPPRLLTMATSHYPPRPRRLIATRANRQPAFGMYVHDQGSDRSRALGVFVVTIAGDRITELTRFETAVLPFFGLPRTLR